jgi:hypothetical protein
MNWKFLVNFWILSGCYIDPESISYDGGGGNGGSEEISTSSSFKDDSSSNSSTTTGNSNEKTDEGFDPCPSDKYLLIEKDGVKYFVIIEVFCDPVIDLNLGCPAPY